MLYVSHPVLPDGSVDSDTIVIGFVGYEIEQRLTIADARQFIGDLQRAIDTKPTMGGNQPASTGTLSARFVRRNGKLAKN